MIAALLVLLISQNAVARGDLRRIERLAGPDRIELRVEPAGKRSRNLLSAAAVRELRRWPELPFIVLHPRLSKVEARQLRKLGRFGALIPEPLLADPSLKLAAPALRTRRPLQPVVERDRAQWPCPDAALLDEQGGTAPLLRADGGVTACVRAFLERELNPQPEPR